MTPYQYFEEISPLLCTTDVPFEIIGDHMQEHVRRSELSEKPRRLLVGGMRARQMLIATPLLKWYLEHEMVITKIYHVVEFIPHRCFRDFVREVGDNGRLGDAHPDKAIIGDTSKLHGNNSYGGIIMDQEKFQSVTYVEGEDNAMLEANKPQVKKSSIQGKTRYQPSRTDRILQLTVCKVKDAPVLLRLSGRLRRQNRLFLLQDGYGFRLRGPVQTRSCFRRDTAHA
jgi:hypothetical protein